jgi:gentisate 1,2-dioxygenase
MAEDYLKSKKAKSVWEAMRSEFKEDKPEQEAKPKKEKFKKLKKKVKKKDGLLQSDAGKSGWAAATEAFKK